MYVTLELSVNENFFCLWDNGEDFGNFEDFLCQSILFDTKSFRFKLHQALSSGLGTQLHNETPGDFRVETVQTH